VIENAQHVVFEGLEEAAVVVVPPDRVDAGGGGTPMGLTEWHSHTAGG
jgi:hypothetical protein